MLSDLGPASLNELTPNDPRSPEGLSHSGFRREASIVGKVHDPLVLLRLKMVSFIVTMSTCAGVPDPSNLALLSMCPTLTALPLETYQPRINGVLRRPL